MVSVITNYAVSITRAIVPSRTEIGLNDLSKAPGCIIPCGQLRKCVSCTWEKLPTDIPLTYRHVASLVSYSAASSSIFANSIAAVASAEQLHSHDNSQASGLLQVLRAQLVHRSNVTKICRTKKRPRQPTKLKTRWRWKYCQWMCTQLRKEGT